MCYCRPHKADYIIGAFTLALILLGLAMLLGPLFVETATPYFLDDRPPLCHDQSSYEACCASGYNKLGSCRCRYSTSIEFVSPEQCDYPGVSSSPPSTPTNIAVACDITPESLDPLPDNLGCSNGGWMYVSRCITNNICEYSYYPAQYNSNKLPAFLTLILGVPLALSIAIVLGVVVWLTVRLCSCCSCSTAKQMTKDYAREQSKLTY